MAQNQDVEGLNQLWEQLRGRYPSHAWQAHTHTLRAWLEQQAETRAQRRQGTERSACARRDSALRS
ncbi:hypothetical protein THIX_90487 [Thiomonas sp. X19]|nr:hypothetical protein THIX_90487 [Thiomonas sp. X19]